MRIMPRWMSAVALIAPLFFVAAQAQEKTQAPAATTTAKRPAAARPAAPKPAPAGPVIAITGG